MDNSFFLDCYASYIVEEALALREGDCLSINTEEEDYSFARLVARKAKERTGCGSYVQLLRDGRITEEFDILSDFPLKKEPTAFLYIPLFSPYPAVEEGCVYDAPMLQRFRLLSDPVDNPLPSFPFVTAPLPSSLWDEALGEEEGASMEMLEDALSPWLGDREEWQRNEENNLYVSSALSSMGIRECRIADDNGTDITFSFLDGTAFVPSLGTTTTGRTFRPSLFTREVSRLIDPSSLEGWINITRPVMLFGKRIDSLSLRFSGGRIMEYSASPLSEALMAIYLGQEATAGRASMVTLAEISNPLSDISLTAIPDWDRSRCVSVTVGGPRGETAQGADAGSTVDSLLSLTLPLGSENTTVTVLTKDGEEEIIMAGGGWALD